MCVLCVLCVLRVCVFCVLTYVFTRTHAAGLQFAPELRSQATYCEEQTQHLTSGLTHTWNVRVCVVHVVCVCVCVCVCVLCMLCVCVLCVLCMFCVCCVCCVCVCVVCVYVVCYVRMYVKCVWTCLCVSGVCVCMLSLPLTTIESWGWNVTLSTLWLPPERREVCKDTKLSVIIVFLHNPHKWSIIIMHIYVHPMSD